MGSVDDGGTQGSQAHWPMRRRRLSFDHGSQAFELGFICSRPVAHADSRRSSAAHLGTGSVGSNEMWAWGPA